MMVQIGLQIFDRKFHPSIGYVWRDLIDQNCEKLLHFWKIINQNGRLTQKTKFKESNNSENPPNAL